MPNSIIEARLASLILLSHYEKIIELVVGNKTTGSIYDGCIDKLKHYFEAEKEVYDQIDPDEVAEYFKTFTIDRLNNMLEARVFCKLKERFSIINGEKCSDDMASVESIINAKKYIDAAKEVNEKINNENFKKRVDPDDLAFLKVNAKIYYLKSFSVNSFLESIAIDNKYLLDNIPRIDLHQMESEHNLDIIETGQLVIYSLILEAIQKLSNITNYKDKHVIMLRSLDSVAVINSLLPYLGEEYFNDIYDLFQGDGNKYDRNAALRKVRKIIEKRKEEFN